MSFADILKQYDLTGYQLAKTTGIKQQTISKYCTKESNPLNMSFTNASKISKALGITMDELFELLSTP